MMVFLVIKNLQDNCRMFVLEIQDVIMCRLKPSGVKEQRWSEEFTGIEGKDRIWWEGGCGNNRDGRNAEDEKDWMERRWSVAVQSPLL